MTPNHLLRSSYLYDRNGGAVIDTTRSYSRTQWQAFPDERAPCIEGPFGERMNLPTRIQNKPTLWARIVRLFHNC